MIIQIDNLHKAFGRNEALRGLSLAVPEGSAYALIGANGAGKTTTIKTVMNIIRPTHGAARILGVDSRRLAEAQLQQIGYVSEN
jgi:ABC-2 type transport system ATP-binding protein